MASKFLRARGLNPAKRQRATGEPSVVSINFDWADSGQSPDFEIAEAETSGTVDVEVPEVHDAWRLKDLEIRLIRLERIAERFGSMVAPSRDDAWFDNSRAELLGLARDAATENWDGEGAVAVTPESWQEATELLRRLEKVAPSPELGIGKKGQVTLDWWGPAGQALSAEVHHDGRVIFAAKFEDGTSRGTVRLRPDAVLPPPALHLAIAAVLSELDRKRA